MGGRGAEGGWGRSFPRGPESKPERAGEGGERRGGSVGVGLGVWLGAEERWESDNLN